MLTLLKNGTVYRGLGMDPVRQDVLIRGKRIVHIGIFDRSSADRVYDVNGGLIFPGFIDVDSQLDVFLGMEAPEVQARFTSRGVTSALLGTNGYSLAPFSRELFFATSLPYSAHLPNIDWIDVSGFLRAVGRMRVRLNLGTCVGLASLLALFRGMDARDLSEREHIGMTRLLQQSFQQGAFGCSFSPAHPLLANLDRSVLETALRLTHAAGRLFLFDTTFGAAPEKDFALVRSLAEGTHARIQVTDIRELAAHPAWHEFLAWAGAHAATVALGFQAPPSPSVSVPGFLFTVSGRDEKETLARAARIGLAGLAFAYVPNAFASWRGKTLAEFARTLGFSAPKALLHALRLTKGRIVFTAERVVPRTQCAALGTAHAIYASHGLLAASDAGGGVYDIPVMQKYAELAGMEFHELVHAFSVAPALRYGIRERGVLEPGYFADCAIIKDDRVWMTFVNGELVYEEGRSIPAYPGMALRAE